MTRVLLHTRYVLNNTIALQNIIVRTIINSITPCAELQPWVHARLFVLYVRPVITLDLKHRLK